MRVRRASLGCVSAVRQHLLMSTSLAAPEAQQSTAATVYGAQALVIELIQLAFAVFLLWRQQFGVHYDSLNSSVAWKCCLAEVHCKAANGFYGISSVNIMQCNVAILKDLRSRRCETVSGGLSGRRPAHFKCETQGLHSSGVSVTVDSMDPFQRR